MKALEKTLDCYFHSNLVRLVQKHKTKRLRACDYFLEAELILFIFECDSEMGYVSEDTIIQYCFTSMENMGSFETKVPKHFTTLLKTSSFRSTAIQQRQLKSENSEHCSYKEQD